LFGDVYEFLIVTSHVNEMYTTYGEEEGNRNNTDVMVENPI
jgi:hypothetical protein